MELKDYLSVLRRRHRWFFLFTGVVMGAYYFVSPREVPHYRTSVQLQIGITDTDTQLSRLTTFVYPQQQPYYTLRARWESLKSEKVLRAAVHLFDGLYVPQSGTPATEPVDWEDPKTVAKAEKILADRNRQLAELSSKARKEEIEKLDKQVGDLAGKIEITPPVGEGSQTVTLTVVDDDETRVVWWAHAVARAAEIVTVQESLAGVRSLQVMLEGRRDDVDQKIKAAESRVGGRKEKLDELRLDRDALVALVQRLEQEVEQIGGRLDALRRGIERATKEFTYGSSFLGFTAPVTAETSSVYEGWLQEDSALEQRYIERSQKVRPEHPDLVSLRERKAFLQQKLNRELVRRHEADISIKLQQERELNYEMDILRTRLAQRRRELPARKEEYERWAREWEGVESWRRQREDLARKLDDIAAVTSLQERARSVTVHKDPVKPEKFYAGKQTNLAFWLLIALCIGAGAAYLRENLDTAITTEYDVRRHVNLPVIGMVPEVSGNEETILTRVPVKSPLSEIFNTAATILRAGMIEGGMKTLVITSANPKEGKTTVAINLAVALARKELRVVLVDTDLRLPQVHSWLGVNNTVGVSGLVEGRLQAMEALGEATGAPAAKPAEYLQTTEVPNLFIVPSGPVPSSPVHVIESKAMRDLVEELRNHADIVIFDSPPICTVSDGLSLATLTDACLFVVGSGLCERREASWAKHLLSNVQARMLGVLLNRTRIHRGVEYYYYYGYYGYTEQNRRKTVRSRK